MKPTLDEEIRRIAYALVYCKCGGGHRVLTVADATSAIYAGIEAWKRQEPLVGVTREQIEAFRREYWIPPPNDGPLEPWAIEENRMLTAICDCAIASLRTSETTGEG